MGVTGQAQRICCGEEQAPLQQPEATLQEKQASARPAKPLRVNFLDEAKDELDEAVGPIVTQHSEQLKLLAKKELLEKGSHEHSATHKTGSRTGALRSGFGSARFSDQPEPDPEHLDSSSPERHSASKLGNLRARFSTASIRLILANSGENSLLFDVTQQVPENPLAESVAALQRQLGELRPEDLPELQAHYRADQARRGPFRSPKTGATYFGQLADDSPEGWGRIISAKGSLVEGWFEKGELTRFARVIDSNGAVYVGGIANRTWNGKGRLVDRSGLQVESCWLEGQAHGPTEVRDREGSLVFKGGVERGLKSGWGYLASPGQQFVYEGHFKEDRFDGRGAKQFRDGSAYEGEFSSGLEHGQGTIRFVDGREWAGKFVNGVPHGPGTLTTDFGEKRACAYFKGRRVPPPAQ